MEKTTDTKILSFKVSTFALILGGAISATFTLTTIYNQFVFQEEQIIVVKSDLKEFKALIIKTVNEKDVKTNERLNKITSRNAKRIEELEKPDSDGK